MIMAFIINLLAEYSLFLFHYRTNVPINPLLFSSIRKTPAYSQEFKNTLIKSTILPASRHGSNRRRIHTAAIDRPL